MRWIAEANFNQTAIQGIKDTPPQLAQLGQNLFNEQAQSYLTVATPRSKIILGGTWTLGPVKTTLTEIRFGHVVDETVGLGASTETIPSRWITNLSANVDVTKQITLGAGADNLFNLYPPKTGQNYSGDFGPGSTFQGNGNYSAFSPYGYSGGFYYLRAAFRFGEI